MAQSGEENRLPADARKPHRHLRRAPGAGHRKGGRPRRRPAGADARRRQDQKQAKTIAPRRLPVLPVIMAACYLGMILFFAARGGNKCGFVDLADRLT